MHFVRLFRDHHDENESEIMPRQAQDKRNNDALNIGVLVWRQGRGHLHGKPAAGGAGAAGCLHAATYATPRPEPERCIHNPYQQSQSES
jgi:hypothetical protein